MPKRLKVFMPTEIVEPMTSILEAQSRLQRYDLSVDAIGMSPGDELALRNDLAVRAFRTYHPVPSLGFQFLRKVSKLKPEFADLPGDEIAARRKAGDSDLFHQAELLELAYATDTLARVLDATPALYRSRVLILECTFLDERKSLDAARAGCHIHLDELIERAARFENDHLVLMHVSQIYKPSEIRGILADRLPPDLVARTQVLAPDSGPWPG
jgi:ribonuclease Z